MRVSSVVAIFTLAEAAGSASAMRLPVGGARAQATLLGAGVGVVALGASLGGALVPAVVALSFLLGVAHPLRAATIQSLAADDVRARAASLASACDMAVQSLVLPLAGAWRSR